MPAEDDNTNLHLAIVLWCQHGTQPCFANDTKFWEPPSWNWKNLGKLGFTEKENCFVNNQEKTNPIQPLHKRIQFPTVKIWISSAKHKSNKLGRPLTHHPEQPRTKHACFAAPLLWYWTLCFAPCPLWPHQAVYGKHSSGLKFLDQSANQCTVKRLRQVQAKDPYRGPCSLSFIQHIFGCGMLFTLVVLRHTIAKGMQVRDTKCRQHAEHRTAQWFETWHSELQKQDIVVQRKQTLQNPLGTLLNNSAVNPRSSPHFSAFNPRIMYCNTYEQV